MKEKTEEQEIKNVVTKMFASGELQINIGVRHVEEDQIRYTVYLTDEENVILQSSSVFL